MSVYPGIGNTARLSCTFTDETNQAADPTVVTVTIKPPDGPSSVFTPVRDGVGAYHYDLALTAAGDYGYRFKGVGAIIAQSADNHFTVPRQTF